MNSGEKSRKKVLIIAPGSRGDVQPYIALGQGLQRAGHRVRLLTNSEFAPLVGSYGLEIVPVDIGVQAALQDQAASAAIERGGLLTSFIKLAGLARSRTRLLFEAALAAALEPAGPCDLFLAGFGGMFVAASLAEKLDRPFVQAYNVPLTPTAAFPGALFPRLSFPPRTLAHRLAHRLTRQVVWQTSRSAGNRARSEVLGLPPAPVRGAFDSPVFRRAPLLYGISPSVLPRPDDWDAQIHVTGFWFADEPPGWAPPPELVAFLDRGPAPVYIGFGSMSTENPAATTQLVLDALGPAALAPGASALGAPAPGAVGYGGRRAIVASGWAGLASTAAPDHVFFTGAVPHAWLFPRVAAAVHHGGAGTTAAALRAGIPSVVVPFHGDQPFWAQLTHQLGVATQPVPRRHLTAERLAAAIEQALTSDALRRRAAALGERVRAEDGVGNAVRVIEAYLH